MLPATSWPFALGAGGRIHRPAAGRRTPRAPPAGPCSPGDRTRTSGMLQPDGAVLRADHAAPRPTSSNFPRGLHADHEERAR